MIVHIVSFFIFFKITSNYELISPESVDLDQENEKILAAIDDIFITLKVDSNFRKIKNVAEYILIHRYIQDAVETRNTRYNEMYKLTKITPDHKTAYYISTINKALREMISEYRVTDTDLFFDSNKHSTTPAASDDILNDFVSLAKQFRLNLNINIKAGKDYDIAKNVETRRVFGGQPVEIRDWPFVVSIHIAGKFVCAGSIIREDLVLSAATCFMKFYKKKLKHEFKSNIWIRAGSDFYNSGGVMVRGIMLHFHPRYDPEERIHNVVVLQLKLKLRYKRRVIQPIRLARKRTTYKGVEIVGWGNSEYESRSVPESSEFVRMTEDPSASRRHYRRDFGDEDATIEDRQLQHSVLERYSMLDCQSVYLNHTITSRHFCAGSELQGSGACKYDLGGPGVIGVLLQGVVSFGPSRCGIRDAPTVFTRIYKYARWLDKIFCKVPVSNDTVDDSGERDALLMLGPDGKKIRKYPFVASVFANKKFVCTGAIIRRELVITVAACLKPFDFLVQTTPYRRRFTFTTNVHVLVGSDVYFSGTLIPVINFHFHYNFDHKTLAFNVVILVLKHKIDFIPGEVMGIHVSNATRLKFKYKQVPVVGWGAECPMNRTAPRNQPGSLLRSVMLNRTEYRECRKNFTLNNNTDFYVSRLHHCLVTGGWGADSLGNLVLVKNRLFGLVSVDCSRRTPDSPTVYIKTAVFSWWINSIMCRYKERFDPSDLSKESDYGSVEKVSSAELLIIIGRKIHCQDHTGAELNCTSINITTYYCERLNGEPLKHGTPIKCPDIDLYTKINCIEGNVTEIDREDVSRSLVNWPHGSTHNGSIYYCVIQYRNSSIKGCNKTGGTFTCHETNCTENIIDDIIYCNYRSCQKHWNTYLCTFKRSYCLDLDRRPIDCPGTYRRCWTNYNKENYCKFRKCMMKNIDQSVWLRKRKRECIYQSHCYDRKFELFRNCSSYYYKICITVNDVYACAKKPCVYSVSGRQVSCFGYWQRAYCLDSKRKKIACPEYRMKSNWTQCVHLEKYIYNEAYMCTEEVCSLAHLLEMPDYNYCRVRNYCYATEDQVYDNSSLRVNETIECPNHGENCRRVNVSEYKYYSGSDLTIRKSTYKMICVQSKCTHRDGVLVDCTSTSAFYCHNNDVHVDCPPLETVGLTGPTTQYPDPRLRLRTRADHNVDDDDIYKYTKASPVQIQTKVPGLITWTDLDADDDSYKDGDIYKYTYYGSLTQIQNKLPGLTTQTYIYVDDDSYKDGDIYKYTYYASPTQIQNKVPGLTTQTYVYVDDDSYKDGDIYKYTYASPMQIQNKVPAPRVWGGIDGYADDDNDMESTTNASPRQIKTNAPAIRARANDDNADDDLDRDYDLELTTYASPRQIQTNVLAIRAHANDDNADDDLDRDNGLELTTYASPRQIQTNALAIRARANDDNADDDLDRDNDLEMTTYASPRQILTNAPAIKSRANDDDVDGDEDLELNTYTSPSQTQTNVLALRARADVDDPANDNDFELTTYIENE